MFTLLGLPMNRYFYVLPLEYQNAFARSRSAQMPSSTVIQPQGQLVRSDFCKDLHQTYIYVDEFLELKN